jgi:hypothetical protein
MKRQGRQPKMGRPRIYDGDFAQRNAKASATYSRSGILYQVPFKLHRVHDADIIQRLQEVPSKAEYLKILIRKDIEEGLI